MTEGIQCDRCGNFERHGRGGGSSTDRFALEEDGWPGGPKYVLHIDDPSEESDGPAKRREYTLCSECRRDIIGDIRA